MKRRVVSEKEVAALVARLATAIAGRGRGTRDLVLIGIKRRGVPLARRIARAIQGKRRPAVPVGAIDITLYRDDLQLVAETPIVRGSEIDFDINGKRVVLVDDVIYTGRTVRAALDELVDFGRPRRVLLAVLVDRGGRELPIAPDVVGAQLEVAEGQQVEVRLVESGAPADAVIVTERGAA